ncbi:MAG: glycoside hydrolase family 38 C-terminal domain-containing protein [Acidimicrobiales bacterium]
MARDVTIVPHTHWDREWYEPFQTFRMRLVELVDDLLPLLDADPGYAHFQLDGQMAVVDDYLAIRPERAGDLRRLAADGRLSMGPWYILMDEFLVSGETMVRDLQLGLEAAAGFGGAMPVGYLPDMFGHVAQMPQLLAQAGFADAVVWRGVPAAVDRDAFTWVAPDGSAVRATYLLDGYGNGATLPDDAKDLVAMVDRFVERFDAFLPTDAPLLWMNGTDHLLPQPWLGRVVAEANELQDRYRLRVGSLADHIALARSDDEARGGPARPRWQGELRSGARANLLMGVASNRVDVKQAAAAAERGLERIAEPASALWLEPSTWPAAFLREAWLQVVRNAAHDSVCACSVDEVDAAVVHRYGEAVQIADGLTRRAVDALAASLRNAGTFVANPSPRARSGLVEVRRPGHDPVPGTQVLRLGGGDHVTEGISRADAATLVQASLDGMPDLHDAEVVLRDDGVLDVRLIHDPVASTGRYTGSARDEVNLAAAEDPTAPARFTVRTPLAQKVLGLAVDVPGFGWSRWEPTDLADLGVAPVIVDETGGATGGPRLANGLVTVDIDPVDGTFALDGVAGLGRLVDDGDAGDTYNYNPPPAGDVVVDRPDAVEVRVTEQGPLRARAEIVRTYRWPSHVAGGARVGEREVPVTTVVEVQAGTKLVRVTTELDNPCRDHRLRAWLPLPDRTRSSRSECAFAVVDRSIVAEGGPTERPLATYPSRRFVIAGGLTVVHDGLLEHELVDLDGRRTDDTTTAGALAVTLLRCTGLISQGPMTYRPLPAGPMARTPAAQLPGHHVLRYAVQAGDHVAAAYAAADEAFAPMPVVRSRGGGHREDRGTALAITGAVVSSVVREGGALTVRLFNPSDEPTTATIEGRRGWLVDLRGGLVDTFEESYALGPWRIATARLAEAG